MLIWQRIQRLVSYDGTDRGIILEDLTRPCKCGGVAHGVRWAGGYRTYFVCEKNMDGGYIKHPVHWRCCHDNGSVPFTR